MKFFIVMSPYAASITLNLELFNNKARMLLDLPFSMLRCINKGKGKENKIKTFGYGDMFRHDEEEVDNGGVEGRQPSVQQGWRDRGVVSDPVVNRLFRPASRLLIRLNEMSSI